MQLLDNKYITKKIVEILEVNDWTIQKLATAEDEQLTKYQGIGKVSAQRIINEARVMVNESTIIETKELVRMADVMAILESSGWTKEQIATSSPDKLLDYCHEDVARDVIALAIRLVNEQKAVESMGGIQEAVEAPEENGPEASVRINRIRAANV